MKIEIHGTVVGVESRDIGLGVSEYMLLIWKDDETFASAYGVGRTEKLPKVGDRIDYDSSTETSQEAPGE